MIIPELLKELKKVRNEIRDLMKTNPRQALALIVKTELSYGDQGKIILLPEHVFTFKALKDFAGLKQYLIKNWEILTNKELKHLALAEAYMKTSKKDVIFAKKLLIDLNSDEDNLQLQSLNHLIKFLMEHKFYAEAREWSIKSIKYFQSNPFFYMTISRTFLVERNCAKAYEYALYACQCGDNKKALELLDLVVKEKNRLEGKSSDESDAEVDEESVAPQPKDSKFDAEFEKSEAGLRKKIEQDFSYYPAYLALMKLLASEGRWAEAEEVGWQGIEVGSSHAVFGCLGWVLINNEKFVEAELMLEISIVLGNDQSSSLYRNLAKTREALGDYEGALDAYVAQCQAINKINHEYVGKTFGYVTDRLLQANRLDEALMISERSLNLNQSAKSFMMYCKVLVIMGRFAEAEKVIVSALEKYPNDYFCWGMYTKVLLNTGNFPEAEKAAVETLKRDTGVIAVEQYIKAIFYNGKVTEAKELAKQAVKEFGDSYSYNLLFLILTRSDHEAEARELIRELFASGKENLLFNEKVNFDSCLKFIKYLRVSCCFEEAEAFTRKAQEVFGNSRQLSNMYISILLDQGKAQEAEVFAYKVFRQLGPNQDQGYILVSQTYLAQNELEKARRVIMHAREKCDSSIVQYWLIRVLIALGEFSQAEKIADEVVNSWDNRREAIRLLADVLIHNRKFVRAEEILCDLISNDDDGLEDDLLLLAEVERKMRLYDRALLVLVLMKDSFKKLLCQAYCLMNLRRYAETIDCLEKADKCFSHRNLSKYDSALRLYCGYIFAFQRMRECNDPLLNDAFLEKVKACAKQIIDYNNIGSAQKYDYDSARSIIEEYKLV